jgi:hypothetical protein
LRDHAGGEANAVRDWQRPISAVQKLHRGEKQVGIADVLDAMRHIFAEPIVKVFCLPLIVDDVDDTPIVVIAARLAVRMT